MFCSKCGNVLGDNDSFCGFCGNQVSKVDEKWWKSLLAKAQKYRIYAIVVAAVLVMIYGLSFLSVDRSCARGHYSWAYKIASERRKDDVVVENLIAVHSATCVEQLKKPDSFVLTDAYYNDDEKRIVLVVKGKNSYDDTVSSYWYFFYDDDRNTWNEGAFYNSLEEEEIYSFDDVDTQMEKLIRNIALVYVKDTIINGRTADDDVIERINNLFEKGKLENIEMVNEDWD